MIKDLQSSAAALYDGGWRSSDREQLIKEYDLTQDEADDICKGLAEMESVRIKLTQDARLCSGEYRIPTPEGEASIMVVENYYQASAEDADGNEYTVIWEVANPGAEDESDMCDWSGPAAIVDEEGREVSGLVELE